MTDDLEVVFVRCVAGCLAGPRPGQRGPLPATAGAALDGGAGRTRSGRSGHPTINLLSSTRDLRARVAGTPQPHREAMFKARAHSTSGPVRFVGAAPAREPVASSPPGTVPGSVALAAVAAEPPVQGARPQVALPACSERYDAATCGGPASEATGDAAAHGECGARRRRPDPRGRAMEAKMTQPTGRGGAHRPAKFQTAALQRRGSVRHSGALPAPGCLLPGLLPAAKSALAQEENSRSSVTAPPSIAPSFSRGTTPATMAARPLVWRTTWKSCCSPPMRPPTCWASAARSSTSSCAPVLSRPSASEAAAASPPPPCRT